MEVHVAAQLRVFSVSVQSEKAGENASPRGREGERGRERERDGERQRDRQRDVIARRPRGGRGLYPIHFCSFKWNCMS